MAGNPKNLVHTFTQEQSVKLTVTSVEWNFDNFSYALGSGNTTVSGAQETFAFGGDPAVSQLALQTVHRMGSGDTMSVNMWLAQSDGDLTIPLTQDEHAFEYAWEAVASDTNWAGVTLEQTEQLVLLVWTL